MAELADLNYHHLQYFWAVARDGNLTRTARRLRVSQSALSTQIKRLEEQLDQKLFRRTGRRLELTEVGRIALAYADEIFSAGSELVMTLEAGRSREQVLRVGAVATLSRNFQDSFVTPLLDRSDVRLRMSSGSLGELVKRLEALELDVVLSNRPVQAEATRPFRCRRLARQQVSLIGRPRPTPFRYPEDLSGARLLLPSADSDIRTAFDALCESQGLAPQIFAEVDDMAMMRLLTIDASAIALLPSVVVRDELTSGILEEHAVVPGLYENFYAITIERRYPHPLVAELLSREEEAFLWRRPESEVHG